VAELKNIRKVFPQAESEISRMEKLLERGTTARSEYSLHDLYEVIHPDSVGTLAQLLAWMVQHHYATRIIRVVSPETGAGLKDFKSMKELPKFIRDDVDTGTEIAVTDKNIEVLYRLAK
jgi:hypothetical protein